MSCAIQANKIIPGWHTKYGVSLWEQAQQLPIMTPDVLDTSVNIFFLDHARMCASMHCVEARLSNCAVKVCWDYSKCSHRDGYTNGWEVCLRWLYCWSEKFRFLLKSDMLWPLIYRFWNWKNYLNLTLVIVVVPRYFSLGAVLPQENTSAQNKVPSISHLIMTSKKKDGAQLYKLKVASL